MTEDEVNKIFGIKDKKRSLLQNASLHLYFTLLADELTGAGYNLKETLENIRLDIPVTPISVKENIFKPVLKAMTGKDSTTQMTTHEITEVWEALNLALGTRMGIHVPFPSQEQTEAYQKSLKK